MLGQLQRLDALAGTTLCRDSQARHLKQVRDYFQRRITAARGFRDREWNPDFASTEAHEESIAPHRLVPIAPPERPGTAGRPA